MLILSTKRHGTSALNVILMEMEAEICTRKWDTEVKNGNGGRNMHPEMGYRG